MIHVYKVLIAPAGDAAYRKLVVARNLSELEVAFPDWYKIEKMGEAEIATQIQPEIEAEEIAAGRQEGPADIKGWRDAVVEFAENSHKEDFNPPHSLAAPLKEDETEEDDDFLEEDIEE